MDQCAGTCNISGGFTYSGKVNLKYILDLIHCQMY